MSTTLNCLLVIVLVSMASVSNAQDTAIANDNSESATKPWCVYPGGTGPGSGKHIVLMAGDDEYRSEEGLPMLGKILSKHHGFKCTVLFPIDPETGKIKPDFQKNIPGMAALDNADLLIIGLRFRNLPDADMKHFVDYVESGKPIIGIRTSTHAFNIPANSNSKYKQYSYNNSAWRGGFGQQVLGETWISHHGHHKKESTRGVVNAKHKDHVILNGVTDVWGPTDVYGVRNLPDSATVLMHGAVLKGMSPDDKPVQGAKNEPMMPLVWTKDHKNKNGKVNKVVCTTMGSSTDFESEHLRRLMVNAAYWATGMSDKIDGKAKVDFVDPFSPTPYGFGNYKKDTTPQDYDLQNRDDSK